MSTITYKSEPLSGQDVGKFHSVLFKTVYANGFKITIEPVESKILPYTEATKIWIVTISSLNDYCSEILKRAFEGGLLNRIGWGGNLPVLQNKSKPHKKTSRNTVEMFSFLSTTFYTSLTSCTV